MKEEPTDLQLEIDKEEQENPKNRKILFDETELEDNDSNSGEVILEETKQNNDLEENNELEQESKEDVGNKSLELKVINKLDDTEELNFDNIGDSLEEVNLDETLSGGGKKKINNELNITRLDDIDLNPDLNDTDITNLVNTNLEISTPIINDNEERNNNDLNSNDILNTIDNEIDQLGTSMNEISNNNSGQVLIEHKDMPTEKKEENVKVIKLDIDKNTLNMLKK